MSVTDDGRTHTVDWASSFSKLEDLAVRGAHHECRELMREISPRSIPREWASSFAELAFRIRLTLFGLKALHRFVHPENSLEGPATDREKVIYSSSLCRLGDVPAALEHLATVDPIKEPEALFYQAIAHFHEWDFAAGVPLLRTFVRSNAISPYRRLVGQVNLASALISEQDWSEVEGLLSEIKGECERGGFQLLLGNTHELMAQFEIFHMRYDRALGLLEKARELLLHQEGIYSLFVDKWIAVCQTYLSRDSGRSEYLTKVRHQGFELGHWETVRDCDLFEAVITGHEELFNKVIIGTPSKHFRLRCYRIAGRTTKVSGSFRWKLIDRKAATGADQLILTGKEQEFDPNQKLISSRSLFDTPRLFAMYDALTRDFYKPSNIGTLFRIVYPDEVFNPFTSPSRVLKLLKRLDQWFSDRDFAVRVRFKKSEFSLVSPQGILLKVQRGNPGNTLDAKLEVLRKHFGFREFSTRKVVQATGLSKASAQRLLSKAVTSGILSKRGQGRGVEYRFVDQS